MNKLQRIEEMEKQLAALKAEVESESKVKQWEPERGDFYINGTGVVFGGLPSTEYTHFGSERKTREAAEKASKAMRTHNRLLAYVAEFAPDYEPDWDNQCADRHEVYFDRLASEWRVCQAYSIRQAAQVYMPKDVAIELCRKLNSGEVVL